MDTPLYSLVEIVVRIYIIQSLLTVILTVLNLCELIILIWVWVHFLILNYFVLLPQSCSPLLLNFIL